MWALLTLMLPLAHAGVPDERVVVVVLPPLSSQLAKADALESALERGVAEQPAFRLVRLPESSQSALLADPGCREQPGCFRKLLPKSTQLIVDSRLLTRAGADVLELRLIEPDGALSRRLQRVVGEGGVRRAAEAEIDPLLAGWSRPARLYMLAHEGNDEAIDQLKARFPRSSWSDALERDEADRVLEGR